MRSFGKIVSVFVLAGLLMCSTSCRSDNNNKNNTVVDDKKTSSEASDGNINVGQPADAVVTVEEVPYDYISAYKGYLDGSDQGSELKYYLYDIKKNNVKDGIRELFLEKIEDEKKQIDVYTIDEKTGEVSLCGTIKGSDEGDLSVKESEVYFNNNFKTVRTVTHITIDDNGKVVDGLYSQYLDENYTPLGKLLEGCNVASDELLKKYSE